MTPFKVALGAVLKKNLWIYTPQIVDLHPPICGFTPPKLPKFYTKSRRKIGGSVSVCLICQGVFFAVLNECRVVRGGCLNAHIQSDKVIIVYK